jgi:hypothetical protein
MKGKIINICGLPIITVYRARIISRPGQVRNRVSWLPPRFQELGSPFEGYAHRSVLPDFQALFLIVVWMMVPSILSCHLGIANTVDLQMSYSSGLS